MIKQYLNNHKCLYKIINIMELSTHIKCPSDCAPAPLCSTPALPAPAAVLFSAALATS